MKTIFQILFSIQRAELPLLILLGMGVLAKLIFVLYNRNRIIKSGIHKIDQTDAKTFKIYVENLFKELGFKVETPLYFNNVADLIAHKNGLKFMIHIKHCRSKIPDSMIAKIIHAKRYYGCDKTIVITNKYYTPEAIEFAKTHGALLWDRNDLAKALLFIKQKNKYSRTPQQENHMAMHRKMLRQFEHLNG